MDDAKTISLRLCQGIIQKCVLVYTLTLYLLVLSADNLQSVWTQIRPDKNVGPDLDPNCLTL